MDDQIRTALYGVARARQAANDSLGVFGWGAMNPPERQIWIGEVAATVAAYARAMGRMDEAAAIERVASAPQ